MAADSSQSVMVRVRLELAKCLGGLLGVQLCGVADAVVMSEEYS